MRAFSMVKAFRKVGRAVIDLTQNDIADCRLIRSCTLAGAYLT